MCLLYHLYSPLYVCGVTEEEDFQSDHGDNHRASLGELLPPVLSSSAPELQGDWKEVKRRMKEKREKKTKVGWLHMFIRDYNSPS